MEYYVYFLLLCHGIALGSSTAKNEGILTQFLALLLYLPLYGRILGVI